VIIAVASGGPDWASIVTAFGTLAAATAAVWIALWSDWHTGRRIRAEHQITREREQLTEAYGVQVVLGERSTDGEADAYGDPDGSVRRLAVMVVNRGSFTITGIEAQFSYDGKSLVSHARYRRLSGFGQVRELLHKDWIPSSERAMYEILTPLDAGIRFESDEVHMQNLKNPYPLVRWTDRWGTRWEHRLGQVRRISDGQDWEP
jgi:hypothetical protein